MKYLILLLCLLGNISLFAQSTNSGAVKDTTKKGLSDSQMVIAKGLYKKMKKTETYIEAAKCIKVLTDKNSDLKDLPPAEMKKLFNNPDSLKKWLADNIKRTNYKSVDEAFDLYMKSIELSKKQFKENPELYSLIGQATPAQMTEIIFPEDVYNWN